MADINIKEMILSYKKAHDVMKKYNLAIEHGSLTQKGWDRLMAQSGDSLKSYLTSVKGSSASMKEYSLSVAKSTAKTQLFEKATSLLQSGISSAVSAAVSVAVEEFDHFVNAAKYASEAADEAFANSNSRVQKNEEEAKSLDELIQRYKELSKNENLSIAERKEIVEIQDSIIEIIGSQAKDLNLLHGNVEEEIEKINTSAINKSQNSFSSAAANYYNAKDASEKVTGDDDFFFTDYDYVGKNEKGVKEAFQNANQFTGNAFIGGVETDGFLNNKLLIRAIGDTAKEKSEYFQQLLSTLENAELTSTDIYEGLVAQVVKYDEYAKNEQTAAENMFAAWLIENQSSSEKLSGMNVNSGITYEKYRNTMLEEAKNDTDIQNLIADGMLSEEDLETRINNFMATSDEFSKYYEDWKNRFQTDTPEISNMTPSLETTMTQIETFSQGMESIKNIYDDIANNGSVDWVSILNDEDFKNTFSGVTEAYEDFKNTITSSPNDMETCKSAFDNLIMAHLEDSKILDELNEENQDLIVSSLEQQNIANAQEITTTKLAAEEAFLAQKKKDSTIASDNLKNATWKEINAVRTEQNVSDETGYYLSQMALRKLAFNQNPINTDKDINAIIAIANASGVSAQYVDALQNALNRLQGIQSNAKKIEAMNLSPAAKAGYLAFNKQQEEHAQKTTDNLLVGMIGSLFQLPNTEKPPAGDTGSAGSTGGSGGTAAPAATPAAEPETPPDEPEKTFEEVFDWIEQRIKNFQRKFDKWIKQAETAISVRFISIYYKKAAKELKGELNSYGESYTKNIELANAVGLDSDYIQKVQNGSIEIETVTDEGLAEKIKKYQEYYDKAMDAASSFVEAAEKLYNIPLEKAASKIEKFKEKIDLYEKKLENAIGAKAKNKLIQKQNIQESKTLKANKKANKEAGNSLKKAKKNLKKSDVLNSPDVSEKDKKKIKKAVKNNKEINLSLFDEGSKAYNAAVKYNESLKAKKKAGYDYQTAKQENKAWKRKSVKMKFDNIALDYDRNVQMIDYDMSHLDNNISKIEASGASVDKSFYISKKNKNSNKLAELKEEKTKLEEKLKAPNFTVKSDEWYEAKDKIEQVISAISECEMETIELNNTINQLKFDKFDKISEAIGRINSEQEFLRGLFAHEKTTDSETGQFTEAGLAKLGSLSASYHVSSENAKRDASLLKELQNVKTNGLQTDGSYQLGDWTFSSLDALQNKIDETYTNWQADIKETYSLESDITDLMKEKYQAELDLMKDLIDAKKEAMNKEKDLHNYTRSIREKTTNISTIQKQIAAYSGDTSQEGLARLQKLQKELEDKKDDLKEAEYDRYISDQQEMLDKLYEEYGELVTKKLDDFMTLVDEGLAAANENAAAIAEYLSRVAGENGYTAETTGLFQSASSEVSNSIQANTAAIIQAITESRSAVSETAADGQAGNGAGSSNASSFENAAGTLQGPIQDRTPAKPQNEKLELNNKSYRDIAENYIKKNVQKAGKAKEEYGAVNQVIYENENNVYSGSGKILPSEKLDGLAKKLGVIHRGKDTSDPLYIKLKQINFPGFKKGGIVSVDAIQKQVKDNGDDGIISVQNGEAVLTPVQTALLKKFTENMSGIPLPSAGSNGMFQNPYPSEDPKAVSNMQNTNNIVNIDSITLPNVKDYESFKKDIFYDMQNEKKFEGMIGDMGIRKLSNSGNFNKYRQKFY